MKCCIGNRKHNASSVSILMFQFLEPSILFLLQRSIQPFSNHEMVVLVMTMHPLHLQLTFPCFFPYLSQSFYKGGVEKLCSESGLARRGVVSESCYDYSDDVELLHLLQVSHYPPPDLSDIWVILLCIFSNQHLLGDPFKLVTFCYWVWQLLWAQC